MSSSRRIVACVVPVVLAVAGAVVPATARAADSGTGVAARPPAALRSQAPAAASDAAVTARNFVRNGSFEKPTTAAGTTVLFQKWIPGWQTFAPSGPVELQRGALGASRDGAQCTELDSTKSATITQTVVVPIAGVPYDLQLSAAARPGEGPAENTFTVTVAGTTSTYVLDGTGQGTLTWRDIAPISFTPTSTSFTLSFADAGPSDGVGALIDNVSITRA